MPAGRPVGPERLSSACPSGCCQLDASVVLTGINAIRRERKSIRYVHFCLRAKERNLQEAEHRKQILSHVNNKLMYSLEFSFCCLFFLLVCSNFSLFSPQYNLKASFLTDVVSEWEQKRSSSERAAVLELILLKDPELLFIYKPFSFFFWDFIRLYELIIYYLAHIISQH